MTSHRAAANCALRWNDCTVPLEPTVRKIDLCPVRLSLRPGPRVAVSGKTQSQLLLFVEFSRLRRPSGSAADRSFASIKTSFVNQERRPQKLGVGPRRFLGVRQHEAQKFDTFLRKFRFPHPGLPINSTTYVSF